MEIIGLAGTNGAGKDTVALMLAEKHGFYFGDATNMLREELELRGLPVDRVHKAQLSAEWRRKYGMAAIVDRAYEHYKANQNQYKGLIVGSLRHPGEADRIHELGGTMLWVDADPMIRYKRVTANAHARGRAAEDDKTFEEFIADEEREMHPIGDEATLHGAAVKERADIKLDNSNKSVEEFKKIASKELGF